MDGVAAQDEYRELLDRLDVMSEPAYAAFQSRLVPGEKILGVRVPRLRALAREVAKGDWRGFLAAAGEGSMEEVMMQGLVVGYAEMEYEEALARAAAFVPKIGSWAVCDTCASSFRFLKKNPERSLEFLERFLRGDGQFAVRFAVVAMMDFFLTGTCLRRLFSDFDRVSHPGYYAKMAVAWAVSACIAKFPERTNAYLEHCRLDDWTYRKAIQKALESYRVSGGEKRLLRAAKRRVRTAGEPRR